eukprot:1156762-Pelagomonas_calceolata.AAC.1
MKQSVCTTAEKGVLGARELALSKQCGPRGTDTAVPSASTDPSSKAGGQGTCVMPLCILQASHVRCMHLTPSFAEGLADLFGSHAIRHKKAGSSGLQEVSVLWTDPLTGLRTYKNEFYVDRGMSWE